MFQSEPHSAWYQFMLERAGPSFMNRPELAWAQQVIEEVLRCAPTGVLIFFKGVFLGFLRVVHFRLFRNCKTLEKNVPLRQYDLVKQGTCCTCRGQCSPP
jgi:hypothetical protein